MTMKRLYAFVILFLLGLVLLLAGCTTTNIVCNDYSYPTRARYQSAQHRYNAPSCLTKECVRYQNRQQ